AARSERPQSAAGAGHTLARRTDSDADEPITADIPVVRETAAAHTTAQTDPAADHSSARTEQDSSTRSEQHSSAQIEQSEPQQTSLQQTHTQEASPQQDESGQDEQDESGRDETPQAERQNADTDSAPAAQEDTDE